MSTAMTRAEIKKNALRRARVSVSDELWSRPFEVNRLLDECASEMTRDRASIYVTKTYNLVSAQSTYTIQEFLFVDSVEVKNKAGVFQDPIPMLSLTQAQDARRDYRTSGETGTPEMLVRIGDKTALAYPTPDYSSTGGLIVRGLVGTLDGLWDNESDVCPFPDRAHITLQHCLTWRIKEYIMAPDAEASRRQYFHGLGQFEAEQNGYSRAIRSAQSLSAGDASWL